MKDKAVLITCPRSHPNELRLAQDAARLHGWRVVSLLAGADAVIAIEPEDDYDDERQAYVAGHADTYNVPKFVVTPGSRPKFIHMGWQVCRSVETALHVADKAVRGVSVHA
jgi:hypothetical protein